MDGKSYIIVAGGVNIDIGGTPSGPLIPRDSNPGKVVSSLGGVGMNIAHNLCLLGQKVSFLTAFGYDFHGQKILSECAQIGLDMSGALCVQNMETSTYVFLNGPDGEMELAVSDMRICEKLTPQYFEKQLMQINRAKLLIIDANLPEESIEYLTKKVTIPIFADMVSTAKSRKFKNHLSGITCIKPNRIEAQELTGIAINDEESLYETGRVLLDKGVKIVDISLSEEGILAMTGDEKVRVKPCLSEVRNVTGAGDAAMAALCYSFLKGKSLREAAEYANAAASIAIESEMTVSDYMSVSQLEKRVGINYR